MGTESGGPEPEVGRVVHPMTFGGSVCHYGVRTLWSGASGKTRGPEREEVPLESEVKVLFSVSLTVTPFKLGFFWSPLRTPSVTEVARMTTSNVPRMSTIINIRLLRRFF